MNIQSVYLQQSEKIVQNSALRKAAASPAPPKLSDDESNMIQKKFSDVKPLENYTNQGGVEKSSFYSRGLNIDTRI
jgi:hypothetical protein